MLQATEHQAYLVEAALQQQQQRLFSNHTLLHTPCSSKRELPVDSLSQTTIGAFATGSSSEQRNRHASQCNCSAASGVGSNTVQSGMHMPAWCEWQRCRLCIASCHKGWQTNPDVKFFTHIPKPATARQPPTRSCCPVPYNKDKTRTLCSACRQANLHFHPTPPRHCKPHWYCCEPRYLQQTGAAALVAGPGPAAAASPTARPAVAAVRAALRP